MRGQSPTDQADGLAAQERDLAAGCRHHRDVRRLLSFGADSQNLGISATQRFGVKLRDQSRVLVFWPANDGRGKP
jgi:hypothetical protein